MGARLQAVVSASNLSGRARAASELTATITTSTGSAEDTIAYLNAERTTLYLAARDGSGVQEVADCAALTGDAACTLRRPRISPNLAMIAIEQRAESVPTGHGDIYLVNFDGTNPRRLAAGSDPAWAPDGTELLLTVSAGSGSGTRIAKVRADGTDPAQPTELVSATGNHEAPDMSPDASQLTFAGTSDADNSSGIYVADADGDHVRRLALGSEIEDAFGPRFSADGTQIIFSATSAVNHETVTQDLQRPWSVRPDGSNLHRLSPDDNDYGPTTETPDEIITTVQVAYTFGDMGTGNGGLFRGPREVVTIPIDGGQPRPLPIPRGAQDASPAPPRATRKRAPQTGHQAFLAFVKNYQPIIHGDWDDGFTPQPFPTVLRYRDDNYGGSHANTCLLDKSTAPDSVDRCPRASLSDLDKNGSARDYLDYPADFYPSNQAWMAGAFGHSSSASALKNALVYFHVARAADRRHIVVQYWLFYSYNYFKVHETFPLSPDINGLTDLHEGDWEHVDILFRGDKLASATPVDVFYSAHGDSGRHSDWGTGADFKKGLADGLGEPTRVRTYAAHGSHANLPYCGDGFATDARISVLGITKTINDHVCKANKVANAYTIPVARTPLDNLDKHKWACWPGIAGAPNSRNASPQTNKLINLFSETGVPRMPLTKSQQGGYPAESCTEAAPQPAHIASSEGQGETLGTTDVDDGPFKEFADCDGYERPGDTPGITVVACDPDELGTALYGGGERTPRVALRSDGGDVQSTFPLVVTGISPTTAPVLEKTVDERPLRIYVSDTPADGSVPSIARFPAVTVAVGTRVRVDASHKDEWKLVDERGRSLAVARPRTAVRAAGPPHLRSVSWSWTRTDARAHFSVTGAEGAVVRVYAESRVGSRVGRKIGRETRVGSRRPRTLRVPLSNRARRIRLVAHIGSKVTVSSWERIPGRR